MLSAGPHSHTIYRAGWPVALREWQFLTGLINGAEAASASYETLLIVRLGAKDMDQTKPTTRQNQNQRATWALELQTK